GEMSTSWPPDIPVFYPGVDTASQLNLMGQTLAALLNPPVFRAERSTALTVTESTHQFVAWNNILEDTAGAWSAGNPSVYPAPTSGWYQVQGAVSLSGTGAASLVLIAAVAVAGSSPIGTTVLGQEGQEVFIPTGASTQPKVSVGDWLVYANAGDPIQIDLWYSPESLITAVDTTAGIRCRVGIVGVGV
ncbi:MAG TPA: hypothetical protein VE198_00490, partial [Actinoallomurus sp.]|nr:hypothetical protein [Actinoallomurus sp.]